MTVVGCDVGGEGGVAGLVIRFVAMEPIDDRVAAVARFGIVRRQVDTVGAWAVHDLAAMAQVLNQGGPLRCLGSTAGNQKEEKAHT